MTVPSASSSARPSHRLSAPLVAVMAVTTGLCAGGNYFNQPLLGTIARVLRTSDALAGVSVTVAQVSYGIGLLLLVPLGDLVDKRRLVVGLLLASAAGQALCGFSSSIGVLLIGTGIAGFFSVAAQVLVPFAAELSDPRRAGRTVGVIMSGLLVGVLLGRSVSGLLTPIGGWQLAYRLTAVIMAGMAVVLWRMLPTSPAHSGASYAHVMASLPRLLHKYPRLATRSALGGLTFAGMSSMFATMAFMLGDRFDLNELQIGLVGLAAVLGALMATLAGRLADRGLTLPTTFVCLGVSLASWTAVYAGQFVLFWFVVAMVLLDVGLQGAHVSNQSIVFALDPAARARLNSVYMTSYFLGGAVGSAAGLWTWQAAGWGAVCLLGAAVSAVSLLVAGLDAVLAQR